MWARGEENRVSCEHAKGRKGLMQGNGTGRSSRTKREKINVEICGQHPAQLYAGLMYQKQHKARPRTIQHQSRPLNGGHANAGRVPITTQVTTRIPWANIHHSHHYWISIQNGVSFLYVSSPADCLQKSNLCMGRDLAEKKWTVQVDISFSMVPQLQKSVKVPDTQRDGGWSEKASPVVCTG